MRNLGWKPELPVICAIAVGVLSAGLLYILIAFDGVRVGAANDAAVSGAYAINLIGFFIAFALRSKRLLLVNVAVLLLLVFSSAFGTVDCFCFGGGCSRRLSNCDATYAPLVGLLNAAVIAAHGRRIAVATVVSILLALPAVAEAVRYRQVKPLQTVLESLDLQQDCVVGLAEFWPDMTPDRLDVMRLRDASVIEVGRFEGERAPRYVLLDASGVHIWKYADLGFQAIETWHAEAVVATLNELCFGRDRQVH